LAVSKRKVGLHGKVGLRSLAKTAFMKSGLHPHAPGDRVKARGEAAGEGLPGGFEARVWG